MGAAKSKTPINKKKGIQPIEKDSEKTKRRRGVDCMGLGFIEIGGFYWDEGGRNPGYQIDLLLTWAHREGGH